MNTKIHNAWAFIPFLDEDAYLDRMVGEHYLHTALSKAKPTRKLLRRCYRALAKAGVEPLPVPHVLEE